MKPILRGTLALVAVFGLASCDAFELSGPKLDENPNIQVRALSPDQYLVGIHSAQALLQEGNVARTVCMWIQHCAGTDRQYSSYDLYSVSEDDNSPEWGFVYAAGGLKDIRNMRDIARAQEAPRYIGISYVWEAFAIGTAAGVWGDIPYSEVLIEEIATPKLDKQLDVYDRLQVMLDSALFFLNQGGPSPGAADLVYNGNLAGWREAAWTLKARYYLATAEVRGTPAYTAARNAALNGISSPDNDFTLYHGTTGTETNVWWQFMLVERDSYLRGSATLIDTLINRGDPRLGVDVEASFEEGFSVPVDDCTSGNWCAGYFDWPEGSAPGENNQGAAFLSGTRFGGWDEYDGDFRQPVITWAENQLILAETSFRLGLTGDALTYLNNVRVESDRAPLGSVTLREIAVEQWITMFQNIEVWNYWRRNCQPNLTPAPGRTAIPARMIYPLIERNSNPNIPEPSAQPVRNQNDPNACP